VNVDIDIMSMCHVSVKLYLQKQVHVQIFVSGAEFLNLWSGLSCYNASERVKFCSDDKSSGVQV
jgi:hypothetical protein